MKTFLLLLLFSPLYIRAQTRYSLVIDEIMADPTPTVLLPNHEWIEVKNKSDRAIDLAGWRLADQGSESGPMPSFMIAPDSFAIICTGSAAPSLSAFGAVITVTNFPSLNNDGEKIMLLNAAGGIVHAVTYRNSWFGNDVKKEGGWSLEMIDTGNPCMETGNWKASTDPIGGTPGKLNSVNATISDTKAPELLAANAVNNQLITLIFDEPVDSLIASSKTHYQLDGGLTIKAVAMNGLDPVKIELQLESPLHPNRIYILTIAGISDCSGNKIEQQQSVEVALPVELRAGDLIINEILFNPRSNGDDYVEIYNRSNNIIDASSVFIAGRGNNGQLQDLVTLTTDPAIFFPGDYFVVTVNAANLKTNYFVKRPEHILELKTLPSLPDDAGDLVVLNGQGVIIDEVKYEKGWHFQLIADAEGVALERVDPLADSQDPTNWHSAASTAGYGTPTAENSQLKQLNPVVANIVVSPKLFSPDNDGRDDLATVQYQITEPGYVARITIFDAAGRPVRMLVNNQTMAASGAWHWDGLNDKGGKLPVGIYIIYTELFNLEGKRKHFKNSIVLVRPLK